MIAYHFPPLAGSSGIQRTLRFVQHLPAFGWEPIVLTVHPRAYERTSDDLLPEVPENVVVERAFALDAARHLSISGRYPRFLARPDRWMSWRWGAVAAGLRLIQRYRPTVLWSTYPIATAHQIGAIVHQCSGLPWVADFRDPMAQDGYPVDLKVWRSFKAIEEVVFQKATRCVFTSPGAIHYYREHYPDTPSDRFALIENGYDEESFSGLEAVAAAKGALYPGKITLLHSGIIYPSERDPTMLFQALGRLVQSGQLDPARLVLRLRAAAHDEWLKSLAVQCGITEVIDLAPPLPYREALEEMMRADGLLVLQAANCNVQIPAKLYEYLRAGRPILGLTDPIGDTALILRRAGVSCIAPLDDAGAIAVALANFLGEWLFIKDPTRNAASFRSRRQCTAELARLLTEILALQRRSTEC